MNKKIKKNMKLRKTRRRIKAMSTMWIIKESGRKREDGAEEDNKNKTKSKGN
jgi:hypothetical protein